MKKEASDVLPSSLNFLISPYSSDIVLIQKLHVFSVDCLSKTWAAFESSKIVRVQG